MSKIEEQKFHFAIGKPWNPDDPNGSVGFYTYMTEIHYCTLNEAIDLRDQFNIKNKISFYPNDKTRGGYRIYQVAEVPNSEYMEKVEMPEKKRVRTPKAPTFPKRKFTDEQILDAVIASNDAIDKDKPANTMSLNDQVKDAQKTVKSWSKEKRDNVQLEGESLNKKY